MTTVNTFPLETTPLATALQSINFLLYRTTSTTSLAIGTGEKVFTVEANKDFQPGDFIVAASDADPADYMYGTVVSYSGTTLTTDITQVGGSGTLADWSIRLTGPAITGETGATGPAAWSAPTAWLTATAYTVGPPASVVTQGGETYVCLVSHTSGTFSTDLAASKWIKVAAKGSDGAGTGDVSSSSNFTVDNRLVRTDRPTSDNKNVQTTGITVDDSNNMSGVAGLSTTTIDLGNADTTLSRSAAGVVSVEGVPLASSGLQTIFIPASAMISRATNGPSVGSVEMTTNKNMIKSLDFDASTQEFAQFDVWFPKSWNLGTVTFQPKWSHASTTTNFGVTWGLAGVALSDGDDSDVAFGTAQTSVDTGGTTNKKYFGPVSSAITIAGTPAAGDCVQFQINRTVADAGDTMAIDARLEGVRIFFTTNAATDV